MGSYQDEGYRFPIRVMRAEQAVSYRRKLETFERAVGKTLKGSREFKPHLLFTWAYELVANPAILDAVEEAIGPNILCWGANFFTKEAHDPSYISWHQDLTYWGLDPADIVTAWVALSPATTASGCMKFVAGSHRMEIQPHKDTFAADNLLSRGQEVEVEVDEATAVHVELQPGEMSLHHVKLIHGSEPNRSADRRIGFAIRYIPTHVRQVGMQRDAALLVRGHDAFGNFQRETPPRRDLDASEALALDEGQEQGARMLLERKAA